jgi:glycerol-3-phosphate acyltransferase PlsY
MEVIPCAGIPIAYILGAIPSSYIIGRLIGKINLLEEGDGHISATALSRRMGFFYFVLAIILDVGKGALAIFIAQLFTDSLILIAASGLAAVIGHCWSIFIKFRGGLGATVIHGVLACLVFWQFLIGGAAAIICLVVTRRSTLGIIALIGTISVVLLIQYLIQPTSLVLLFIPASLLLIQYLKRLQIKKSGSGSNYAHDLFKDMKSK